jgi:hypothetical protein
MCCDATYPSFHERYYLPQFMASGQREAVNHTHNTSPHRLRLISLYLQL